MSEFIGNMIIPSTGDVRVGVGEGSGGSEFIGNFILPSTGQVVGGIGYGTNGIEFLGTLFCINENIDLFIHGPEQIIDNITLSIHGTTSGLTIDVGDDNFGITLDELFKNADYSPQIIGRFTGDPNSVTIEVWDMGNNSLVLTTNVCYQIGDTGRWAWSTKNLPGLKNLINQYVFRMTGDNLETFESQFILKTQIKEDLTRVPRNNSHIRKI